MAGKVVWKNSETSSRVKNQLKSIVIACNKRTGAFILFCVTYECTIHIYVGNKTTKVKKPQKKAHYKNIFINIWKGFKDFN